MPGFLLDKELGEGRDPIPMPSTGPGTEAHSLSVSLMKA